MTYIVAISAYLVLLTIFGLIVARKKVKTSDDMVTGGHRIQMCIRDSQGAVRFSWSYFNTEAETDAAAEAVCILAAEAV